MILRHGGADGKAGYELLKEELSLLREIDSAETEAIEVVMGRADVAGRRGRQVFCKPQSLSNLLAVQENVYGVRAQIKGSLDLIPAPRLHLGKDWIPAPDVAHNQGSISW